MHELSVCRGLLAQVTAVAREHRAERVTRIVVRIGPLSGVVAPLLREAFLMARAGTPACGAHLDLEEVAVRVRCLHCGAESEAAANRLVCGTCGDWQTRLIGGDELLLARVELADSSES